MTQEEIEGNRIIADFDDNLKYKPVRAGYERRSSYVTIERLFNTFHECFDFCDAQNYGKHPDECFFALPDTIGFELKYHTSLDWLKPAIDKIESTYDDFHGYFLVHIVSNSCTIQGTKLNTGFKKPHYAYFAEHYGKDKIEAVFLAVVSSIEWYNQAIEQVKQTT